MKRLAETHGGEVGVRTLAGRGCTFWFDLPRAGPVAKTISDPGADKSLAATCAMNGSLSWRRIHGARGISCSVRCETIDSSELWLPASDLGVQSAPVEPLTPTMEIQEFQE